MSWILHVGLDHNSVDGVIDAKYEIIHRYYDSVWSEDTNYRIHNLEVTVQILFSFLVLHPSHSHNNHNSNCR